MQHSEPEHIIQAMAGRWKKWKLLTRFLLTCAAAAPMSMLLQKLWSVSLWLPFAVCVIGYCLWLIIDKRWNISAWETARYLDKTEAVMEESTTLLLLQQQGLLKTLQSARAASALRSLPSPKPWLKQFRYALLLCVVSAVICIVIWAVPFEVTGRAKDNTPAVQAERKPEGVSALRLLITPPAYTGKPAREQSQFGVTVEEDAVVKWTIHTHQAAQSVYLLFNDSLREAMTPDAEHRQWRFTKKVSHTGFYQLVVDAVASELYRIDMVADESPSIVIHQPAANTVIDFGMAPVSTLKATVSDDYGISSAWIMATIASGSGEGVKFREEQLRFPESFSGQSKQYQLQRLIDLSVLKMIPGDELYCYVLAKDNAGHERRSDILIITLADTAQLMSLSGLQMGVTIKPDYFRSQRQIIIETEQLLREKDTLGTERFKERSNNLGIDQKLLRMRYGKFLGEENSLEGEGEHHDDEHDGADVADGSDFGNADKILDAFTHKHDISEDATFFSAETKAQLKATLAEMWNAELRLRMYQPREALPYEYKALRLLKELQQKDRVYVAKTSVKTTPLKPEKRLTADLTKVQQPGWQKNMTLPSEDIMQLKLAMSELDKMKTTETGIFTSAMLTAYKFLSNAASQSPGAYLQALNAMKRLQRDAGKGNTSQASDVKLVQSALQKLVVSGSPKPYQPLHKATPVGSRYFQQLQQPGNGKQ